jgi:hypothetical protein
LQAQRGMVRCGHCAQVFDGFKTLTTLPDSAPREAPVQDVPLPETQTVPDIKKMPVMADEVTPRYVDVPPAPRDIPPTPREVAIPVSPAFAPAPVEEFRPQPSAPPVRNVTAPRRRSGSWGFGVLLMLIGLAAQAAYFYRSDIAAFVPETRPHLAKMCELLRCVVALPQRPRQITIEASDLQATDPANPGLIALTATMRNQASTELGYPALDVVLTNTKDHTVARRIFLPADYLAAGKDARGGIAPNAEVTIRLDLDTGDLGAAGFRLDLIAAPVR